MISASVSWALRLPLAVSPSPQMMICSFFLGGGLGVPSHVCVSLHLPQCVEILVYISDLSGDEALVLFTIPCV